MKQTKKKATIAVLAKESGVSVATVNRVLSGSQKVRRETMELVEQAAQKIGFYGKNAIQQQIKSLMPKFRFTVLLLQPGRHFYETLGDHLNKSVNQFRNYQISLNIVFLDNLSPEHVAEQIIQNAKSSDGIGVVAASHPLITEAIEIAYRQGVMVTSLISPLSADCDVNYVGLDNWKAGRTAAWTFHNMCSESGKIGILIGNHRFRNQDVKESGFRSYFRECQRDGSLLEPLFTYESRAVAREMTEKLLAEHANLEGIFVCGGGITGVLNALQENRDRKIVTVGFDLFDRTRAGLIDGTLTLCISFPYQRFATEIIQTMLDSRLKDGESSAKQSYINFEIFTSENL